MNCEDFRGVRLLGFWALGRQGTLSSNFSNVLFGVTKASTLHEHTATRQGRHKGAGKGTYTSCSEGGGSAHGGLPTPLSGA
eukprot:scaffold9864_cov124-Isochrysis_galbana.AAC.8